MFGEFAPRVRPPQNVAALTPYKLLFASGPALDEADRLHYDPATGFFGVGTPAPAAWLHVCSDTYVGGEVARFELPNVNYYATPIHVTVAGPNGAAVKLANYYQGGGDNDTYGLAYANASAAPKFHTIYGPGGVRFARGRFGQLDFANPDGFEIYDAKIRAVGGGQSWEDSSGNAQAFVDPSGRAAFNADDFVGDETLLAAGRTLTLADPTGAAGSPVFQTFSCSDPAFGDEASCLAVGTCSNPAYPDQASCEGAGICTLPSYATEEDCTNNGGTWDGSQCLLPARDNDQGGCEGDSGSFTPEGNAWNPAGNTWDPDFAAGYTDDASTVTVRVYARDGVRGYFSAGYAEASVAGGNTGGIFRIDWTWDAVPGATGYRLLRDTGGGFTEYADVSEPEFADDGTGWTAGDTVTPSFHAAPALRAEGPSEFDGDAEVVDPARGVVLRSPSGTRFRIAVDDSGALTTAAI